MSWFNKSRTGLLLLLLVLLQQIPLVAQYPEIRDLQPFRDPILAQLLSLVSEFHQSRARGRDPGPVNLFLYRSTETDSLMSLSSRFNLPYDTLASLNALGSAQGLTPGTLLLIPSQPGLFVYDEPPAGAPPQLGLERVSEPTRFRLWAPLLEAWTQVSFYPEERFHPLERAFFLGILFRFPLNEGRISSYFGHRPSPFTGHPSYHNGLDIAAPEGTPVYAAREGIVTERAYNRNLGNFLVIQHENGFETVYGHLKTHGVTLNQRVGINTIIGEVGSTGMSTGPHLHLEIRRGGAPWDPLPLLAPWE